MPRRFKSKPVDVNKPMDVNLFGEATAIGDDTVAETHMLLRMFERGGISLAGGRATASADAQSSDGRTAYATADTGVSSSSADLLIMFGGGREYADADSAHATSTTRFLALDIAAIDRGQLVLDFGGGGGQWRSRSHSDDDVPSGNVARATVDARVSGEHTFLSAEVHTFSLEDALSTVAADIFGALG